MEKLYNNLLNLTESPLYQYRISNNYLPVLGEGTLSANLMLVGEAPGLNEAKQGIPFCGASGKILTELLNTIGFSRNDVYITNIVKDRPPNNRDPNKKEIETYGPILNEQIKIIKPKVIAALGRFSTKYLLEKLKIKENRPISKIAGTEYSVKVSWGKIFFVPLYHPAVALYNQNMKEVLINHFKLLKRLIK